MILLFTTFGIIFGFIFGYSLKDIITKYDNKKVVNKLNNDFKSILDKFKLGKTKFKSRFNYNIYIELEMEEHGNVDLIYMMDKKDIAIFKGSKCILTTITIEKSIIKDIIEIINKKHYKDINDTVNLFGMVLSKNEFENITKMKIDDFNKMKFGNIELSDIDKIIQSNDIKFNIDDILDKISSIGIESLTKKEKEFLENYSKK